MNNRTGSHQLSNGLIVSGRPELKERQPTMSSRSVIYTGGDVRKSGELGRMYGVDQQPPSRPPSRTPSGSARSGPNSGQQPPPKLSNSGPLNKKLSSSSSFSGPLTPIQPTGLITSGPNGSARRSGQMDGPAVAAAQPPSKAVYGSAVTSIKEDARLGFRVSKLAVWAFLIVVVMGLVVGAFLMVAVHKAIILVAVAALLVPAVVVVAWNYWRRRRGVVEFLKGYRDCSVREAVDGEYIKVTGVVTCGNIPLETSFRRIPRCVYVSTELYEYRGCRGRPANSKHRFFSWGCRHSEKYVADFYVSDNVTGARALVKTGFGAKVATFVEPTVAVDVTKDNKELSPNFVRWLSDRGLSSDDRVMRLKESYVKEGNTVSVMGMVRRHDNVIMIVPPEEPFTMACRLLCCLLPAYVEGLILTSDHGPNDDAIPV